MAELWSLTSLYILLGVLAGLAILGAVVSWAARRAAGSAEEVEAAADGDAKRKGLLNKEVVVVHVPAPEPEPVVDSGGGDGEPCAICKGRLAGAEGPCRRLRPCGHVYHAECIDLWLERKRICPLCRAAVVTSRTETIDGMV